MKPAPELGLSGPIEGAQGAVSVGGNPPINSVLWFCPLHSQISILGREWRKVNRLASAHFDL